MQLSYRELQDKSHGLAVRLQEKGVGPDTLAAIMAERSIEMVIGILGVLQAGGAYLPMDPHYPAEGIDYMLKDSNARVLVSTSTLVEEGEKNLDIVLLGAFSSTTRKNSDRPDFHLLPATGHRPPATSLAYVIYTSGSTGRPKGVLVEHRAVINRLKWMQDKYPLTVDDGGGLRGRGFIY